MYNAGQRESLQVGTQVLPQEKGSLTASRKEFKGMSELETKGILLEKE